MQMHKISLSVDIMLNDITKPGPSMQKQNKVTKF